ncbi:TonB C-terminal domain-containing protein [bacterium]|nr:TonB C-terminal domain-containing protein [bacterium]
MFRCTECNIEYTNCPDFCECGNDTFEEFFEEEIEEEEYEEPVVRPKKKKKAPKLTEEELEELEEEMLDRKKALITIGISLFISLILIFCPPHMQKKSEKVREQAKAANVKIPDVNSYWDNTVAYHSRKNDAYYALPILNKEFGSISTELREYLKKVGNEFYLRWEPSLVKGSGECKVTFTIDKEGNIDKKYAKITERSNNESLDDSVLMLLSKLNTFDIPPSDYKGERIIIAFKKDETGVSKVYFPY